MYDKDGNGSVDLAEMVEIIGTLYDMEGASKVSKVSIYTQCGIWSVTIILSITFALAVTVQPKTSNTEFTNPIMGRGFSDSV